MLSAQRKHRQKQAENEIPTAPRSKGLTGDLILMLVRAHMTSQRQTDANRRNALLSTGPRTEEGKQASRQNAIRHGLTAETVIGIEDAAEYTAFEAEILTDYDPQSTVERELTLRLASLLWRLRRASLIETGLLQMQCEFSSDGNSARLSRKPEAQLYNIAVRSRDVGTNHVHRDNAHQDQSERMDSDRTDEGSAPAIAPHTRAHRTRAITRGFLQLADLPSAPFERIGRYEAALWRQFVQVLFGLDEAKRHRLVASRRRFTPYPPQW